MKKLLSILLLSGCVAVEKDDRICLDWGHYPIVEEKCTPLYGNLICVSEERTQYWCKLYEEKTNG